MAAASAEGAGSSPTGQDGAGAAARLLRDASQQRPGILFEGSRSGAAVVPGSGPLVRRAEGGRSANVGGSLGVASEGKAPHGALGLQGARVALEDRPAGQGPACFPRSTGRVRGDADMGVLLPQCPAPAGVSVAGLLPQRLSGRERRLLPEGAAAPLALVGAARTPQGSESQNPGAGRVLPRQRPRVLDRGLRGWEQLCLCPRWLTRPGDKLPQLWVARFCGCSFVLFWPWQGFGGSVVCNLRKR